MIRQFLSGPVTEVQTTKSYDPGQLVTTEDATYGTRTWRYIKNAEASTALAVGTIVQRKAATADDMSGIVCVTANKGRFALLGVSQSVIAAGSFGFILKEGIGSILADGSIGAGDTIMSEGTTGRAKTATLTTAAHVAAAIGFACADDGAADTTVLAHVNFP